MTIRSVLLLAAVGAVITFAPLFLKAAATDCESSQFGCFEISIPGTSISTSTTIDSFVAPNQTPFLTYARFFANVLIALTVAVGIIMIVAGGFVYMTAGGSGERISKSKTIIGTALLGIALALTAFIILNTISPQFAADVKEPPRNTVPPASP